MHKLISQMRKAWCATFAAVVIATAAAPAFAGWQPNDDDALLFDVRSGQYRLGEGVRGYQTDTGVCVDFTDIVLAFDLPVRIDKKSRRATGWLFEESRTFTLDRDAGLVQIVNKNYDLGPSDIRDTPDGWCVDTNLLGRWLAVDLRADVNNALLIVKADRKLPFELAEERKGRAAKVQPQKQFDLSSLPQARDPYRFLSMPSVDVVASTSFARDAKYGNRFDARYEVYASGDLAGASFDARLSSNGKAVPQDFRFRLYRSDPNGGMLGPLNVTHMALGDVSMVSTPLGIQNTVGRGAFITNRPLGRAESFNRTSFRGELPNGWDAELYRNDQLIGYSQSRGDGRYEFLDVDLLYGQNRFEVVLYGPQGQIRRDVRMIPVGLDSIPPRETYFWAGIQDTGRDLISFQDPAFSDHLGWRGGFGLERGIDARTSIGLSYSTAMFEDERQHYVEANVRRALGPTLVELAAASNLSGGFALRGQMLGQFGQTMVSAESNWMFGGYQGERYDRDLQQLHSIALDHNLRFDNRYVPVHGELRYSRDRNGSQKLEAISRLSFNIKQINNSIDLEWEKNQGPGGVSTPSRFEMTWRTSGRIGGVRLRGETRFGLSGSETGFRDSTVTAEWRAGEKSEWRAEVGYSKAEDRARLAVGHSRQFKQFALTGQAEIGSDGSIAAGLSLAFSLGPNPGGGGIRVASEKLAAQGQALAVVFQDENADGIRQPNEPLEKQVELTAGLASRGDPTDEKGRAFIDGLEPYQPVLIGIDASSLSDPFMQPANSGIVVTPRPGVPVTIELPLVAAGEISGTLQREGGKNLGGVEIQLLDKSGRVVKSTRSEYDGYFLFEFVPYGKYSLRVAGTSATIVGIDTNLPGIAELARKNPMVDLGIVVAKPALRVAAMPKQGP